MKTKNQRYRVYIAQVNQTYVEVIAKDSNEARDKGYRKWRNEEAHARILQVSQLEPTAPQPANPK